MIYQIGNDLPFRFAYIASKLGATGLTVTVKAAYRDGVALSALVGAAIAEVGNGLYLYTLDGATYNTVAGIYIVIATTADTSVDQRDMYAFCTVTPWVADIDEPISDPKTLTEAEREAIDTELSTTHGVDSWESGSDYTTILEAIKAKTDRIGTGNVLVVAPVRANGNVDMVIGDAYKAADNRSFDWSNDDWNISESSAVVIIVQGVIVFTATRISATHIQLELSPLQSAMLIEGTHTFHLREIQVDDNPITHLTGTWIARTEPAPMPED
jgi:hypothetical protein